MLEELIKDYEDHNQKMIRQMSEDLDDMVKKTLKKFCNKHYISFDKLSYFCDLKMEHHPSKEIYFVDDRPIFTIRKNRDYIGFHMSKFTIELEEHF